MKITTLNDSKEFKHLLQSGRLNFLIGSGLSSPYLETLGDIEKQLEENLKMPDNTTKKLVRASIIKAYFELCIGKNYDLRHATNKSNNTNTVLQNYKSLLQNINKIILLRRSNLHSKQINLFTTNVDIFLEKSLESAEIEFNDGFAGRLDPRFNLSNFKKSLYKTSQHYDNKSELPMFNLFKLHGSVTWCFDDGDKNKIKFDNSLEAVKSVRDVLNIAGNSFCEATKIVNNNNKSEFKPIADISQEYINNPASESVLAHLSKLENSYSKIPIINPTKEKFEFTTLNYTYYELLRMFSNELERENSVLFVMGFSFADEHIRQIVLRSINANPTLIVYIFAYNEESAEQIQKHLTKEGNEIENNNLKFIMPDDNFQNDLAHINAVCFKKLADSLTEESKEESKPEGQNLVEAGAGSDG